MSDDPNIEFEDLDDFVFSAHHVRTTFGDLYPSLAPVAHWQLTGTEIDPVVSEHRAAAVVVWFLDHGAHTVGDVLALDVNEPARWANFGVTKVERVTRFVERLDASATALLAVLIPSHDELTGTTPPELRIGGAVHDLSALLEWAHFSSGAATVEEALTAISQVDAPADVAEVVTATLAVPVPHTRLDPLADLRDWMAGLDERDAAILHRRLIRFEGSTLDDLGLEFGVTRERIRQVETKLKARLDAWVASGPGRSVRWALHLMSRGLGASAPDTEVPLVGDDGGNSDEFGLLLYLADMVWDREAHQIHRRNFRWPKASEVPALDDGPQVDEAALAELLIQHGIVEDHLAWAMEQVVGLRRLHGTLVFWPGNLVEQAMSVLSVHGSPMTDDDIADAFDRDFNRRGLRDRMLQDPRIIRVTKDDFALTSWGLPEYGGIVSSMVTRIEEAGPARVREIAEYLAERHAIKPGSVYAYSSAPIFTTDGDVLRLRRADEPYMPSLDPSGVRGLYRLDRTRLAWHVQIEREVLRGSGRLCPAEIATAMGVFPGRTESLSNEVREVKVGWAATSHMGPSISSLRPHAEAVGAKDGDVLRLIFDRGTHAVTAVKFTPSPAADPQQFLSVVLDLEPDQVTRHRLAEAIFVEDTDLEAVLERRGETAFAAAASALVDAERKPPQ